MPPKDADGMACSVDPNQTAPSLICVCTIYSDIYVPCPNTLNFNGMKALNIRLHQLSEKKTHFITSDGWIMFQYSSYKFLCTTDYFKS